MNEGGTEIMEIISLNAFRQQRTQQLRMAMSTKPKATCGFFNQMPANKLSKFCLHCKFENTDQCPKKDEGQVGLTPNPPLRTEQAASLG